MGENNLSKEVPEKFKKVAEERDQYLKETQENPIAYQQLKNQLIDARMKALTRKNERSEADEKDNADKGKSHFQTLDEEDVANVLMDVCHFVMFHHGDNARIATYDVEQGIYTYNVSRLRIYISYVAPKFNKAKADNVIYHLTNKIGEQPAVKVFRDPKMIPVGNGIYNPSEHVLYPYAPNKFIVNKIQTSLPWKQYDGTLTIKRVTHPVNVPEVKSPIINNLDGTKWDFDSWLATIANQDKEIVKLLWQVLAVTCNASRQTDKAIFLLGKSEGNNGKGTFQTLVENLVGETNYATLKISQFSGRFSLENIVGKSVVIGDDNPTNVIIHDKSNFNSIVTNDPVTIEPKGEKSFTAKLNITTIQSCNALPRFADDGGVYRRMIVVPFNADFNGQKENKAIKQRYLANRTVLQYVLYKALENGDFEDYFIPKAAKRALEKYEHTNNPVYSFIDDVWKSYDGHDGLDRIERLPIDYLYNVWKNYQRDNGYHEIGKNTFNQKVLNRVNKICDDNYILEHCKVRKSDAEMIIDKKYDQYCYGIESKHLTNVAKTCLKKSK